MKNDANQEMNVMKLKMQTQIKFIISDDWFDFNYKYSNIKVEYKFFVSQQIASDTNWWVKVPSTMSKVTCAKAWKLWLMPKVESFQVRMKYIVDTKEAHILLFIVA